MTVPFTKLESSEPRNRATFAISSDWPARGMTDCGIFVRLDPNSFRFFMPAVILVITAPGAMALQRIPLLAYIIKPVFFVNPTTACFEAVYAAPACAPFSPPVEAVLTITPCPFSKKIGKALRVARMTPFVLILKIRSHLSSQSHQLVQIHP